MGAERCLVVHPLFKGGRSRTRRRLPQACLDEAAGLARAIGLSVAEARVIPVPRPRSATLLGRGAVDSLASLIQSLEIGVAVVDGTLNPVQQRNLENSWACKVIDRTGLILEIFGQRARTKEGVVQVELAALTYARSRLVRSWTHLERQRGGLGFVGGPGETQIEIDRRLIGQRIAKLEKELSGVARTRGLHRQARQRVPYPAVALVGYTNAGKSTLFNTMTQAKVVAKNQLFATLDPTMRSLDLPSGRRVVLSDTVGFISDLPHELINAFHATLEEVTEADIILHVRDVSHPDSQAQREDVEAVLKDLGLESAIAKGALFEVLNKIDLLDTKERAYQQNRARYADTPCAIPVSALTGEGQNALLEAIDAHLGAAWQSVNVTVSVADGALLAWLYAHGEVVSRKDREADIQIRVRLSATDAARLERRGGQRAS